MLLSGHVTYDNNETYSSSTSKVEMECNLQYRIRYQIIIYYSSDWHLVTVKEQSRYQALISSKQLFHAAEE